MPGRATADGRFRTTPGPLQGEIDRAVRTVTGRHDFELYGSGRTDAGVHASAQVAHLDVATHLPPASLRRALNDELPADINVLDVQVVPHRFHARHAAVGRRYLYQIATRRTAFAKPFVWWVKEPLNIQAMRDAARQFVGMRDFQSFAADDDGENSGTVDAGADRPSRSGRVGRPRAGRRGRLALPLEDGPAHRRRAGGDRTWRAADRSKPRRCWRRNRPCRRA